MNQQEKNKFTEEGVVVSNLRRRTYKNLIVISLGFLFLFTAFQALQNLQSSIHDDENLGLVSLCVIYAALVTSCMFVPPLLINKLGCKYTVMLSMSGYVIYTVAMFYPQYWTLVPASALLGFCGAPLWSAKCSYVTSSGIKYSKAKKIDEDNTITNFFGLFFLIFQTGQIWGNLISSQVLKPSGGGANTTEDVGEICGANFCPSTKIMDSNQKTADSTVKTLMGIYLAFGCLAITVVFLFLDKIEVIKEQNRSKGICDLFIATLKHVKKNNKMKLLIPITMFSGLEQGFVFADFTKSFITCALGIEKVGLIMICFGAVDAFFSLFLGKIVEWFTGRPIMMLAGAAINMGLLISFLFWKPSEDTLYVFFLGAAFWGFADAVWQTQVNVMLKVNYTAACFLGNFTKLLEQLFSAFYGVLFPTDQEAAFSNYRLWESIGFVVSFAYANFICTDVKIYILIGVLSIGIILYVIIELIRKRELSDDYTMSIQGLNKR